LLPFTGSSVGTANNFERAALFAEERVANAGGVNGRPLRIIGADTHSSPSRARQSAESLVNAGVTVVVGPESAEIAADIGPYLAEQGVTFLSPLIGAANNAEVDCSTPWFRLAPSAQDLGEALAKQIAAAGIHTIAVVYTRTAYDQALSDSLVARFSVLKGSVAISVAVDPEGESYANEINVVQNAGADAVVLATSLKTGALIASEFDLLSPTRPVWFLSPLLKTELLLVNAVPGALEGARGVAPKIYEDGSAFPKAFAKRWEGEQPLEGADFYYDAIALLAFAFNAMTPNSDGSYDASALNKALHRVSAPPGSSVGWDEIESGLERQRDGSSIYYSGLTGPLLFKSCGDRAYGASTTWHVHGGAIVTDSD
jgi:ABC-type branched-subunit amino acid transport system substrate-binding protein